MTRVWLAAGMLATIAALAGCDNTAAYASVFRDQLDAIKELTRILESVTDRPSMAAAKEDVVGKYKEFEKIRHRALLLPKASARVNEQLTEEFGPRMEEAMAALLREIRRIRDLPGGQEFLENLGKLSNMRKN
jgi:hypothetical protein